MSKEYSKSLLNEIRKIADEFSDQMSKQPENLDHYSPDHKKEVVAEYKNQTREKALKQLDTKLAKVNLQTKDVLGDINKAKFPLLNASTETEKLRGEQSLTNVMLILQTNFSTGNSEGILNAIELAMQSKRYDFVTALIEQIDTLPAKDDVQMKIKEEVSKIAEGYFKERGVTTLNEELNLLQYANEVTQLSAKSINGNNEHIYIPDFPVNDFHEQMLLENLRSDAGVNESNSSAEASE